MHTSTSKTKGNKPRLPSTFSHTKKTKFKINFNLNEEKSSNVKTDRFEDMDFNDFNTSLILCETFLAHSLLMYNNLPNQNNQQPFTNSSKAKSDFFEQLPQEFTRQQAIEIGKPLGLADRTIDSLLKNALGIKLEKIKAGHYHKI